MFLARLFYPMLCLLVSIFTGVLTFSYAQCDSIAALNKDIVSWVDGTLNKKVGNGECWELARMVLNKTGANWDGHYGFGRALKRNECVMPGDIIQFEKVKTKRVINGSEFREDFPHHTAIIYQVISMDELKLIHQNTGYNGKKVAISDFFFSAVKSGKYTIYRPEI